MKSVFLLLIVFVVAGCDILYESGEPVKETKPIDENTTQISDNLTNQTFEGNNTIGFELLVLNAYGLHNGNLTIYFLDDDGFVAAIVTPNDKLIIIDSGVLRNSKQNIRDVRNLGFLEADVMILSSVLSYRVSGVPLFTERLNPTKGYYSGVGSETYESYRLVKGYLSNFSKISHDQLILMDDTILKFYVPYDDGTGFREEDEQNSILTKVTYKDFSILFGSDCFDECEDRVSFNSNLSADVLALPLMGRCEREVGTSTYFLKTVGAEINVGNNVCERVTDRVNALGLTIYDEIDGKPVITSDGKDYTYYIVR